MTKVLRMALLVTATALMSGAIWGAVQSQIARGLTFFFLAFLCVVFAMIIGHEARSE